MSNDKVTTADISIDRIVPSGAYRLTALVNGYLVSRQYMGYTKREAIHLFKDHIADVFAS